MSDPVEISWFAALCDDDYEFLGVTDPALRSSWDHCRDITLAADRAGFDNILLPSGYELGIDSVAFGAAIAPLVEQIHLLLAVRIGEMWLPQLARQIATIDQMAGGRLTINIISSDMPGQRLDSEPRYKRTLETMQGLRKLLSGEPLEPIGDFIDIEVDPPRAATVDGRCPPFYFGGFSEAAKDVAAAEADVFLTWPDTIESVAGTIADMRARSQAHDRELRYGLRTHVIVRETEAEARQAADRLISRLDPETGAAIRGKSLDAASVGVQRQADLRESADDSGYVAPNLWTGIGRGRSGAGAALVGDPDQIVARLREYRDAGVDAFILSGYPHIQECELVARHILPELEHQPLKPRF